MDKNNKIAVFLNDNDSPTDFYKATKLVIYNKKEKWTIETTIKLNTVQLTSVAKVRQEAVKIYEMMNDCKTIAASEFLGIPYSVFEMAKCSIFIIEEINDDVLDGIMWDVGNIENELFLAKDALNNLKPVQISEDGNYYIDLIGIQKLNPEISSKKLLKDFLETTPFMELKIKCKHTPPWIEENKAFELHKVVDGAETLIKVTRKMCN